ncbi:TIR domain-containing protein [Alicyclobacillus macrosporangiidus]|uniref:TIR domain-containing protein n=1 Tax=Alicyclobacillus macrosporangiidus TaxID=392015 RepID=UPI0022AE8B0A|nr:TIR domain-containing protein [Alicyclobacillus macrosporangiidus]
MATESVSFRTTNTVNLWPLYVGCNTIEKWINDQMFGRSCTVVLVGERTAERPWIKYEIKKSWSDGKGLVGICIHNLKDRDGKQAKKGRNPFDNFTLNGEPLSDIVKLYDPPYSKSEDVYKYIKKHISDWVEEA